MFTESRLLAAVRAIVRELLNEIGVPYHAVVRYRVQELQVGRAKLQRVSSARGFPDSLLISFQPGAPGMKGEPQLGAIVLVTFAEGDPRLPVITNYARTDDPAWLPVSSSLDASGVVKVGASATAVELASGDDTVPPTPPLGRVLRYGDLVNIPGVGDVVIGAPAISPGYSKVSA
jgi:hypothetical protein